jgi:16S rRNA (adenine1518-N6/adenine1519-N6)-dimethyltransferase
VGAGEVRAVLERHGLLAHRDRGQNFLVSEAVAERLVALAGVEPGDRVLEIGTGLGVLTRALARRGARVVTLEVDAGLVRALRAEDLLPAGVELRHEDALRADLGALAEALGPPVRLLANLPYSISGPLLRRLLDLRGELADWSVMLQREVAERVLARPGTKAYGSLSVLHQLAVRAERALDLEPGHFWPVPQVRSSFLRLVPRADAPLRRAELAWVERVVRAGFAKRRKTLANALRAGALPEAAAARVPAALSELRLDPRARAEALAPEELLALARALVPEPHGARGGELHP